MYMAVIVNDIHTLESEISKLIDSEVPYQKDFALLTDQEQRICQVIELFDELISEKDLLSTAFQHMMELHTSNVSFPDMENLTDFSLSSSNASQLVNFYDSYINSLKKVCIEIDQKKEEIGRKIESIEGEISSLKSIDM